MLVGKIDLKNLGEIVAEGARRLGLRIDDRQARLFETHASELLTWNRKTNLTAVTDPTEMAVKHFVDSIAAAPLIPEGATLLDIGSGGGFPGIPLKIAKPSISCLLVDASRKKVSFLQHVVRTLKLENISARHVRAEELANDPKFRETFGVVACRALTELNTFFKMASPLVSPGGFLLAYKAKSAESEIEEARKFIDSSTGPSGGWIVETRCHELPVLEQERTLVVFRRGM
jgi:16S rRNA (guanine527-N7)-methyltransferase